MRVLFCTLSVAHCLWLAFVSFDGPNPQDPAKALKAYYQDRKALDWQAALTKVAGPEGPERDPAAAWLRAILAQALKDEKSGDAPWEPTPFFGEGPRNPALELRKAIAKTILESDPMPGAVPILAWYFEEEYVPLWQEQAATALGRVKGPAAAKLRAELASKPHPNSAVATQALQQIARAKESLPAEKLAALCQHHHLGIREAARALNQQLKYADPGPFNAAQALRSSDVQQLLKDLSALVIDKPPADAPFVLLKTASFVGNLEMPGWLVHEDADKVEIITLPTNEEWETLKKKLTRMEQIDFLCERMRLLNCFQGSQPGRFDAYQQQYAESGGMSGDASFGGYRPGRTKVINPLAELGRQTWTMRNQKFTRDHDGDLTIKDIPQLSKYLRDDWQIPSVSFFRDFAPGRTLHSTRPIFAELINGLANKDLCEIKRWRGYAEAQIDKELERIVAWAKENANKSPAETEWQEVRRILQDGTAHDKWSKLVYQKAGPNDLAPLAALDLEDKNEEIRIYAALIVAKKGGQLTSLEILGAALQKRGLEWWTRPAVETLLADGSPKARNEALRLFAFKDLHLQQSNANGIPWRAYVMRRFADADVVESYRYYLKQLDNNDPCPIAVGNREMTWAQVHVGEFFTAFREGNPAVKDIRARYRSTFDAIDDVKQWLKERIEECERKEKAKKK